MTSEPKQATLWRFPEAEFADWLALVGGAPWGAATVAACPTFADYERQLAAAAEELVQAGYEVRLWLATVQEMRDCLRKLNLANTPANRAAVIAGAGPSGFGKVLGLKLAPAAVGWSLIQRPELLGRCEVPIVGGDFRAAMTEAIRQAEEMKSSETP